METEHFAKDIQRRVQRRLAADGLNEVGMGLLLVGACAVTALQQIGFRMLEDPLAVAGAMMFLLFAVAGVPALRRRYVDPYTGYARPPRPTFAVLLCFAAVVVSYTVLLELDEHGRFPFGAEIGAATVPLGLVWMARWYDAKRLYVAATVTAIGGALLFGQSVSPSAILTGTSAVTGLCLMCTGLYTFSRFLRGRRQVGCVTQ
jgi:hypothetical protein